MNVLTPPCVFMRAVDKPEQAPLAPLRPGLLVNIYPSALQGTWRAGQFLRVILSVSGQYARGFVYLCDRLQVGFRECSFSAAR